MKTPLLIFAVLLAGLAPNARQSPARGAHFSKDGLSFDYPAAGWALADTSTPELQRATLTRAGGSNIIMVFAQREVIKTPEQFNGLRVNVTMPYVANIANKLGLDRPPGETQCLNVGNRPAVGFRMAGQLEGEPTTAEVYTVVLGQRLLHLVNIRNDKDEAAGAAAWKTLLDTLKVEGPPQASPEAERLAQIVSGGVLNGKAIKKPQPRYPPDAKAARAQGVVVVQIVVDEGGNVTSAQAVSGNMLLRGASEEAARRAKFEPVAVCGKPVKVSGIVTYNFIIG
jgi:TonB family protein